MKYFLFIAIWFQSGYALSGINWAIQPEGNSVEFTAIGKPGFLEINGTGAVASGTIVEEVGKVSGTIEVLLSPLKTGLELRDKHMKEKYLDVAKFPKAVFVLDPVLPLGTGFAFTGKLTVKADTVAVSGKAKINTIRPNEQEVTAEFSIPVFELKSVGVPSYMGITVADKITVKIKFKAVSK